MYRSALDYLEDWKDRKKRKPLVIRGARQVGKSFLVSMFAEKNFPDFIEINFERTPEIISVFNGSPEKAIQLLELHYNKKIDIKNTLIFLDEIQAAPEVFAKLRYFYEEIPGLPIIAAGSLLEFLLKNHTFSMPVGRIEYLYLGPMTFEEFLIAKEKNLLLGFIRNFSISATISELVHSELISLFRTYLVTGGMPESVSAFVESGSFHESEIIRESILRTYEDDFNKYSPRVNHQRVLKVFNKIPLMVGDKFKYINVDKNERAKTVADALHMLEMAKIAFPVKHSGCNGVPLGAEVNDKKFKVCFLDTGLMASACGMSMLDIENTDDSIMINAGGLCEQFVGQHLFYLNDFYKKPELYYWVRETKSSSAEIDYVISHGSYIIPVEVKAGKTGRLKSLHQFIKEKNSKLAVRINTDLPTLLHEKNKVAGGGMIDYELLSIPFYLTEQIRRLIQEVLADGHLC